MAPQTTDHHDGLDFKAALPLYYQLKELIKRRIAEHVWGLEEMIPSENELSSRYGVSVGTVKRAFSELVAEGVLYRRQGKGTFVNRPDFKRSFIRFFRYGRNHLEAHAIPGSRVLASRISRPPGHVRDHLRLSDTDRTIVIKRVRTFEAAPLVLEELYLPESIFRGFEQVDISKELLYPIYDAKYHTPIIWAEEFLEPAIADAECTTHLGITPGAPVISVERIAYTFGDRPVEFRSSVGRGDRFRYHVEIR